MDAAAAELIDNFPRIYRKLLPDLFRRQVPAETLATCRQCAMCRPEPLTADLPGSTYFNPSTKCCTFQPALANYLVGGILSDPDPAMDEGRSRIRSALASGVGCLPTGIVPSAMYAHMYQHRAHDVFGRAVSMRCSYFREGEFNCTIWKHRNATCSTWFCKHVKGKEGQQFWLAAKNYVAYLEWLLPRHFALEAGLDPPVQDEGASAPVELGADDIDGRWDENAHAAAWGAWKGREEAFYIACYEKAQALGHEEVLRISGTHPHDLRGRALERAYNQMMEPKVPDPLLRNPRLVVRERPGDKRHVGVGGISGIEISAELLEMLWCFNGLRTTQEALSLIQDRHEATLTQALVTSLYHHRVLVDPARQGGGLA
ncbi:MAG: hypothetical protein CL625_06325 [Arenimonas sp.]|nr:hypothetical protein [Arenimonas sp.]